METQNGTGEGVQIVLGATAQEKLRQMIAAIERLEEEKAQLAADIKERYAEAKVLGYDTKALRRVIRDRKRDRQEREQEEQIVDLYRHAVGDA